MADRYWVGGTGNWSDDTNHWSASSGGSAGASLPTSSDDVYIDSSSGFGSGGTITIDTDPANALARDFIGNTGGHTWDISISNSEALEVYGSLEIESTAYLNQNVEMKATTTGHTVDINGYTLDNELVFDGDGGGWTLLSDARPDGLFAVIDGTLDADTYDVESQTIFLGSVTDIDISMGTGTWKTNWLSLDNSEGGTFALDAETSTVELSGGNSIFDDDYGVTFNNFITGDLSCFIDSDITASSITMQPDSSVEFIAGLTITADTWDMTGTAGNIITLTSGTPGSPYTFDTNGAVFIGDYLSIKDSAATDGTWYAGDNSTDVSGNTGWLFSSDPTTRYWIGDTGNWSDDTNWSGTSGGTGGYPVPDYQKDVYFDANSFSAASQVVTLDEAPSVNDMDWTGATNSPTLSTGVGTEVNLSGDLVLISAMTVSDAIWWQFYSNASITSAGNALIGNIDFYGTDLTLNDALDISGPVNVDGIITNSHDIDCGGIGVYSDQTSTFGTSTVTSSAYLDLDWGDDEGVGISAASATFVVTADNYVSLGANTTIGTLTLSTTNSLVYGNGSTVGTLNLTANTTITMYPPVEDDVLNIATAFNAVGTAGNLIVIESSPAGRQHAFSKASGTISASYVDASDSNALGGATWEIDLGIDRTNNSGWTFTNSESFIGATQGITYSQTGAIGLGAFIDATEAITYSPTAALTHAQFIQAVNVLVSYVTSGLGSVDIPASATMSILYDEEGILGFVLDPMDGSAAVTYSTSTKLSAIYNLADPIDTGTFVVVE